MKIVNDNEYSFISLGAGVQSSTLLFLYEKKILRPMPNAAIFADTQSEPKEVYTYLEYLKKEIKNIPILTCTAGNLVKDNFGLGESGKKNHPPPLYVRKEDGKIAGMLRRQCTYDYKILPVQKLIRQIAGVKKYERIRGQINLSLGISTDEIQRMKASRVPWLKHRFPLIDEKRWSRQDCLEFYDQIKLPKPPRSACYMCPYKSNKEWAHLKKNCPEDWAKAVKFDNDLRTVNVKKGYKYFVHPERIPLELVDLTPKHSNKLSFLDECEGMCGV